VRNPPHSKYRDQALAVVPAIARSTASLGTCGGTAAEAGDDLPRGHGPIDAASPTGAFTRECMDFALWRVNQEAGSTSAPFPFTNSDFRGDGGALGNAVTRLDGWRAKGWPVGTAPQPGAVVYYASGAGEAGALGHVRSPRQSPLLGRTDTDQGRLPLRGPHPTTPTRWGIPVSENLSDLGNFMSADI
jgi:hypothetical protein